MGGKGTGCACSVSKEGKRQGGGINSKSWAYGSMETPLIETSREEEERRSCDLGCVQSEMPLGYLRRKSQRGSGSQSVGMVSDKQL